MITIEKLRRKNELLQLVEDEAIQNNLEISDDFLSLKSKKVGVL